MYNEVKLCFDWLKLAGRESHFATKDLAYSRSMFQPTCSKDYTKDVVLVSLCQVKTSIKGT